MPAAGFVELPDSASSHSSTLQGRGAGQVAGGVAAEVTPGRSCGWQSTGRVGWQQSWDKKELNPDLIAMNFCFLCLLYQSAQAKTTRAGSQAGLLQAEAAAGAAAGGWTFRTCELCRPLFRTLYALYQPCTPWGAVRSPCAATWGTVSPVSKLRHSCSRRAQSELQIVVAWLWQSVRALRRRTSGHDYRRAPAACAPSHFLGRLKSPARLQARVDYAGGGQPPRPSLRSALAASTCAAYPTGRSSQLGCQNCRMQSRHPNSDSRKLVHSVILGLLSCTNGHSGATSIS